MATGRGLAGGRVSAGASHPYRGLPSVSGRAGPCPCSWGPVAPIHLWLPGHQADRLSPPRSTWCLLGLVPT